MIGRIEIQQIDVFAVGPVQQFELESPRAGEYSDSFGLQCLGWFISREAVVRHVSIDALGAPVDVVTPFLRQDVCNFFPSIRKELTGGFAAVAPLVGLIGQTTLSVMIHFEGGGAECVATIVINVTPIRISYEPRRTPTLVTCGGRVGSSVMMALISGHPAVVTQGRFPYEDKSALFWLRACWVLTMPSDHIRSTRGTEFEHGRFFIGCNPYPGNSLVPQTNVRTMAWPKTVAPRLMYEHFLRLIDSYYDAVAADMGRPSATHFVEKANHGVLPSLLRELYPKSKEIFLVRDPRDMYASILAFNRKRGFSDFGAEKCATEFELIDVLGRMTQKWLANWALRKTTSLLVKYEELMEDPFAIGRRVFDYLELDGREDIVRSAVDRTLHDDDEVRFHRTSESRPGSVSRWRAELSPDIAARCQAAFEPVLRYFGYELR